MYNIYRMLVVLLVLYICVSFSAGLPPFENHIFEKEFLPSNEGMRYFVSSLLLLLMLLSIWYSVWASLQNCDVRVLLSKA